MIIKTKSISFKMGIAFSGIFIALLLILGSLLYGVFTNVFIDYIKQDLLARGNNHARILAESYDKATIAHVVEMEKGVTTNVLITDNSYWPLSSSTRVDDDMKSHLQAGNPGSKGRIIEDNWRKHNYIISVSRIGKNKGYVYMYYPSKILREIVFVMNLLVLAASAGILLLAFGLIGILSGRMTRPLLVMKEATKKMALGKYKQEIPVRGEDEIAQLGRSIQELGEQLKQFEDSRNDFIAAVSHELRTPLTYIKGYSDVLTKGLARNPEEQAEYLKIINKEAQRVSFLVNDLFEMGKLQTGRFQLSKEQANINQVIEKVLTTLLPAAQKKGLDLKSDLQQGLPEIWIDIQRMEQVFYNLIENSIKYTMEGSITVKSYIKQSFIMVEIQDTGIGIPQEDIPKIFDRFYRVDQSRTRKTGGTGLGLYVVKQIIEAHDGEIQVSSSTESEGSVFTVFLKIS